jgi:hypothetical protein
VSPLCDAVLWKKRKHAQTPTQLCKCSVGTDSCEPCGTGRNGFGTHVYTNGDQWDGVWDGDKPHGAGLYIAYNNPDHKVKAGFIKQGDPIPTDGRGAILSDDLRKEDKVRIIQVLTLLARATPAAGLREARAWESTRQVIGPDTGLPPRLVPQWRACFAGAADNPRMLTGILRARGRKESKQRKRRHRRRKLLRRWQLMRARSCTRCSMILPPCLGLPLMIDSQRGSRGSRYYSSEG